MSLKTRYLSTSTPWATLGLAVFYLLTLAISGAYTEFAAILVLGFFLACMVASLLSFRYTPTGRITTQMVESREVAQGNFEVLIIPLELLTVFLGILFEARPWQTCLLMCITGSAGYYLIRLALPDLTLTKGRYPAQE